MTEREIILAGKNITKCFGGLVAVNDVSFELYKGEILGLIGPNGAGKTTLFNMISGTMPMTQGTLFYHGETVAKPRSHKLCLQGIGRTYQICQPFGNLTVLENVMVGAFSHCKGTKETREYAYSILEKVGMAARANVGGGELTLPELKRMEVARALATRPDVLLLDEVIAGLNPSEVDKIIELIRSIRDEGISIIIIEHVMKAIMNLSDRIICLVQGAKASEGTPQEVASDPVVIESYLGGSGNAAH